MKTWVIPDIHGCFMTFRYLVENMVRLQKDDKLYILGDMIDRGPDSKGVLDYIMQLQSDGYDVTALKGNHEDYMLRAYEYEKSPGFWTKLTHSNAIRKEWFRFGGEATLQSFGVQKVGAIPSEYIDWLTALPIYAEYKDFLIVHAGFNFKNDDIFEDTKAMLWTREFEIVPEKLGGKKIIHGHVPVDIEFIYSCLYSSNYYFVALDNGVYMANRPGYGNLTALELNTTEILIQPNMDQ